MTEAVFEGVKRASVLVALWVTLGAGSAAAQFGEVPIIEAGREQEVLLLFSPYTLTGNVRDGFRMMNVRIEATHIVCELVGPEGASASVRLDHREHAEAPDGETASFAVRREATTPEGRAAADAIYAAVRDNDVGGFYRRNARPPRGIFEGSARSPRAIDWLRDGSLLCLLGLLFFVVLVGRELLKGSRAVLFGVVGLTAVGAALRVMMSPETMLGAWPFSRMTTLMRLIWAGPGLGAAADAVGARVGFFDVVATVNLIFAIATPPVVFLHAKKLLDAERAALLAAAVVALLPVHLRFSHSEVAFIPSLALSSFTFALVHIALKDDSRRFRIAAVFALPLIAGLMFVTRPLNQIFLPLLLWTALYLARRSAPLSRRLLVSALVTGVGALAFVFEIQVLYGGQIAEGASLTTLWNGVWSFFTLAHNTLIHPFVTPTGLLLLAIFGAWLSLRPGRPEREKGVFLVSWLGLFYVAHAYVLPHSIAMQARYHLHLVVPFVMLVAIGLSHLYARRRTVFWLVAGYIALTPFIHHGFIRDVAFDDQREYTFVRSAAEHVPDSCTVLEYTGAGTGDIDVRFDRVGALLAGRTERRLFTAISVGASESAEDPLTEEARAVLDNPPACLFYYEGLFCYGRKEPNQPIASACEEMHHAVALEEVATTRFMHRVYDGNLATGMGDRQEPIALTLFRVAP